MDSMNLRHNFTPLDLEILDIVYEAAWAHIEARDLYRDPAKNSEREDALRKAVLAATATGPIDFDTVYDKVLASLTTRPRT